MTREIKFRAWDRENKVYYKECDFLSFKPGGVRFMWTNRDDDEQMVTDLKDGSFELLQYTGLKDKNGKEIYEGDVLECGDYRFKIEWNEVNAQFALNGLGDFVMKLPDGAFLPQNQYGEVIGNIYENPELIQTP